jgi:hypothetical protein
VRLREADVRGNLHAERDEQAAEAAGVGLGFVYKKAKCVPAKADAAVQEKFATETLLPLMAQAGPNNPLYFVDDIHPADTGQPA